MIETVIFIIVLGVAVSSVAMLFSQNVMYSHEPLIRQKAVALLNAYMDEVVHKRWNENSPVGGGCVQTAGSCATGLAAVAIGLDAGEVAGVRSNYDDIDDYNGLNDAPPEDANNVAMPGYAGFSVSVAVTQPASSWNSVPVADTRRIQVSVTSTAGETLELTAYRTNF
jgi:MSHA pilin protein MshD